MYLCTMMWREIGAAFVALVVMFWNVENYFDPFDDPLKNDNEFTPGAVRHWTWARFEAKRDGLAQTILAAGDVWGELPALVALAEVENRLVVSQLVRKTMLEELGYGYVHRESPDERGIDVALLYRKDCFRVLAVDSLRVPGVVTRDILYVKGLSHADRERAGDTLHVFVVHLPSKRGGAKSSDGRRTAALSILESAVDSLLRDDPLRQIIVMGDFNDTDCDVAGLRPAPHDTLMQDTPGTLKYHGRWEQIDHFFVSPSVDAVMRIFAPPFLLEPDNAYLGVKPRRTYIGPRHNGGLSDHLPIIMRSKLDPLEDRDDSNSGGSQEADEEEERVEEPDGDLQRASVRQFVVDDLPAQFPAHEEDHQQAADEHQHVGRGVIEQVEDAHAKDLEIGQDAQGKRTESAQHPEHDQA
jgi:endonuclease/exonuclease/phosphatase family metal-dependent hydrolase